MDPKTLILLSGGADSTTAMYEAVKNFGAENVSAILFDYGAPHNACELNFARGHCHRLGVRFKTEHLPPMGGLTEENWVVPFRNACLLSHALSHAAKTGVDYVVIGCNKDDADYPFPDCSEDFISSMNRVAKASGYSNIEVLAPYIKKRKVEIITIARKLGVPLDELWTCYQPKDGKQCGECPACLKLEAACGR